MVEALGGWHSDAAAAVSKLARQLASHTGREEEETTRYFFQRLESSANEGDPDQNSFPCLSRGRW